MTAPTESGHLAHEVRAWAIREGHVIGSRGRIAEEIKALYAKAPKRSRKAPKA